MLTVTLINVSTSEEEYSCSFALPKKPAPPACQPIYRHSNGVTIKAGDCAIAGQEYEFE